MNFLYDGMSCIESYPWFSARPIEYRGLIDFNTILGERFPAILQMKQTLLLRVLELEYN